MWSLDKNYRRKHLLCFRSSEVMLVHHLVKRLSNAFYACEGLCGSVLCVFHIFLKLTFLHFIDLGNITTIQHKFADILKQEKTKHLCDSMIA